jgi:protein-S-isoprenylcysteine O-methyltransferase Ste14
MMLAFITLSVTFQNWLSIVCLMLPVSIALAYRIYVEEIALEATFGETYHAYVKATKRLIPGVF